MHCTKLCSTALHQTVQHYTELDLQEHNGFSAFTIKSTVTVNTVAWIENLYHMHSKQNNVIVWKMIIHN